MGRVIVITGMHRSGTSLVAGVMQRAGVNIGERLLDSAKGNLRGHFEDVEFLNLHDRILSRSGQSLLVQDRGSVSLPTSSECTEAVQLISQREGRRLWGWKDPRTALFLDFWAGLIPAAQYVFIYRHPVEVALSLLRRGTDMEALADPTASLRSWQVYNQSIIDFLELHPASCLMCSIAGVTADIGAFVDLASRKLSLPLVLTEVHQLYHEEELKQVALPVDAVSAFKSLMPEISDLYERLEALSDLPSTLEGGQSRAESDSSALALQGVFSDLAAYSDTGQDDVADRFEFLLSLLDPEAVLRGKQSLDAIRRTHIASLEEQIAVLHDRVSRLDAVRSTGAYRFAAKYSAVRRSAIHSLGRLEALAKRRMGGHIGPGYRTPKAPRVLFVSHDAGRTGAPILLLYFLRWLRENADIPFEVLLANGAGELRTDFESIAPTLAWHEHQPASIEARLRNRDIELIYSNTITNGRILSDLSFLSCPVITHVHELNYWINYRIEPHALRMVQEHTDHYIAVSKAVRKNLVDNLHIPEEKIDLVYEYLPLSPVNASTGASIRRRLGIPQEAFVVGACGTTDWRKGADLFVALARAVHAQQPDGQVHFVWLGGKSTGPEYGALWHDVTHTGLERCVHFLGQHPDPLDYIAAFDVFALTSREDPFPLVNLEAASVGKPIVCFDGAGGAPEFVEDDCGFVVPYLDIETMAARVVQMMQSPQLRQQMGRRAAEKVRDRHDLEKAARKLLDIVARFLA